MTNTSNKEYEDFLRIVKDLIDTPEVNRLRGCRHHYGVSRYDHCVNVAYHSFLICRKLGLDYTAAARAGLMHDLFYYDWYDTDVGMSEHALRHSAIALGNAEKLTELTDLERDIIKNHMWLCNTKIWPRHRETYIVSVTDKLCAVSEAAHGVKTKVMLTFAGA